MHEVTVLSGSDLTSEKQTPMQSVISSILLFLLACFDSSSVQSLFHREPGVILPSFGSYAAGPACDGAVDVREVGVVPRGVSRANLHVENQKGEGILSCRQGHDS